MTSKKIAFVITDAVSFNTLMRGQLEFLKGSDMDIHRKRCAGHTLAAKFQGSSSLILLCLWSATMARRVELSQT